LGLDHRIGQKFLHAGIGDGGSCFPKDVKAFLSTAKEYGVSFDIVEATDRINANQRRRFFDRILSVLPKKGRVCLWGLSFKPRTDDIREAPSLDLIRLLIKNKHTIAAYDPFAMEHVRKLFPESILYAQKPLEAAEGADAIALLTEWDVFRGLDLTSVRGVMRGCHFFDGRNIYEPAQATAAGLTYYGVGMG
ncbi:MAG: UDP binding domain-containing protein, partial [Candidatus Paceibacterota bacterium]